VVLFLAAPGGLVAAQRFVFTSDRFSPLTVSQYDLFLYDDGSELRLTHTPDLAEYDPSPSADGNFIAYAATTFIASVTSYDDSWQWSYHVIDDRGQEVANWKLTGLDNDFRPAGGFDITWLGDNRSFLAQTLDEEGNWEVRRYLIDAQDPELLAKGFGIELNPDGLRFATARGGTTFLIDILSGQETPLLECTPLAWTPDGRDLYLAQDKSLLRVPLADPEAKQLVSDSGPYLDFHWSPDHRQYAYTTSQDGTSAVFFHDADDTFLVSFELDGFAEDFDWLDDETLLLELARDTDEHLI